MHVATAVSHFGWKEIHRKNSVGTVPLMWAVLLTCDDEVQVEDEGRKDVGHDVGPAIEEAGGQDDPADEEAVVEKLEERAESSRRKEAEEGATRRRCSRYQVQSAQM